MELSNLVKINKFSHIKNEFDRIVEIFEKSGFTMDRIVNIDFNSDL